MKSIFFTLSLPLFILCFGVSNNLSATHLMGSEITYQYVGPDRYLVKLILYRDCTGATLGNSQTINVRSIDCSTNSSHTLNQFSVTDITPICPNTVTACAPQGNINFGFEQHIFQDTITLASTCKVWEFSHSLCCRNAGITNGGANESMYIFSTLDLSQQPFAFNNSPVFEAPANLLGVINQTQTFNFHAIDADGDSLSYKLVSPLISSSAGITYNPGFSPTQPFLGTITFDSIAGILTVTDSVFQVAVVSLLVEEYRAGYIIGSIRRDIQMHLIADTNNIPVITGIDSSSLYELFVYEGDTVDFDIYSVDGDTADTISMTWDNPIQGSQYSVNGVMRPIGNFYWETDTADVQYDPHLFKVYVRDNNCPINGQDTRFFKIYVLAEDTTKVWPGDADNDHIADLYDVLPIGIGYNATGAPRAGATTNWVGQAASNWNQVFANGLDYKYADCNGNGTIDTMDLDAITLNYGLTHARITLINANAADPELYMELDADTFYPGDWVTGNIYLGSASNMINDFYGLTFGLNYDNSLIDGSTVEINFQNNWAGQLNTDLITYTNNLTSSGSIKSAMVRTNQQNKSGFGLIGTFKAKILDQPAAGWNDLNFSFTDLKMIDVAEQTKPVTTSTEDAQVSSTPVGLDLFIDLNLIIYPNPASNRIFVINSGAFLDYISVLDIQGREILRKTQITGNYFELDISNLSNGIYLIHAAREDNILVRQISVKR